MSESSGADILRDLYKRWKRQMDAMPDMPIELLRAQFDEWHQATKEPEGVTYSEETLGSVPVLWAHPEGADNGSVLLYCHGGGFAVGSAASHRKLAGQVGRALGISAVVMDYRRSPEYTYPAQIEDAVEVYRGLLDSGFAPDSITTVGDSAGGNLAISCVHSMRENGLPVPASVIVFSPWLDMEHSGKSITANKESDDLIDIAVLESMAEMFLGRNGGRTDPLANPLYASFKGFPRLYINAGACEMLVDDARRLNDVARHSGVDVTLSIVDGMQHVFPFLAGRAVEADDELARIARWFHRESRHSIG